MTLDRKDKKLWTRRDAILRVSSMLGGVALVGQASMLAGCGEAERAVSSGPEGAGVGLFDAGELEQLDEIAETILPETDTPGAKAADVGAFMALMVTDCYFPNDQAVFRQGLAAIDQRARESFGSDFVSARPADRLALLEDLDREQFEYMADRPVDAPRHFFRMMKELALLGYFTSEIGYTQAMRYRETPGRWDPCLPYEEGETSWADHA